MSILAKQPDLEKIINKAIKRIGENHALARDNKGVEMKAVEIEEDRKEFRKGRNTMTSVIEESLKAVADEMAEKMVLENTIDGMIKDVIQEQETVTIGGKKYSITKTVWDLIAQEGVNLEKLEAFSAVDLETLRQQLIKPIGWKSKLGEEIDAIFKPLINAAKQNEDGSLTTKYGCIDGNCENGTGTFVYENGDKYVGEWKDGKRHGQGTMTYAKGSEAKGQLDQVEYDKIDYKNLDESTTDTIKKLVNKKLKDKLAEARGGFSTAKHPGLDTYEKSVKKSKTENNKAMKDTDKKFKEYNKFEYNDNPEFPHQELSKTNADGQFQYYRNSEEDQEFVDDFAHPGLIDFDINNLNLDRLTKYLEGSSETGNAQTDKDGNGLGNVVPSDLGKKMMKSAENRKEKIAQQKASMSNLRGYTPDVQKVKQVKEGTEKDMDKMKKLWSYNKKTQ